MHIPFFIWLHFRYQIAGMALVALVGSTFPNNCTGWNRTPFDRSSWMCLSTRPRPWAETPQASKNGRTIATIRFIKIIGWGLRRTWSHRPVRGNQFRASSTSPQDEWSRARGMPTKRSKAPNFSGVIFVLVAWLNISG